MQCLLSLAGEGGCAMFTREAHQNQNKSRRGFYVSRRITSGRWTADTQQNECAFAGPLAFVSTLAKSFSFVDEETISNNVECKYLVL